MNVNTNLSTLTSNDLEEIANAFYQIGWNKPKSIYESYLSEQKNKIRTVFVAKSNDKFTRLSLMNITN